MHKLLPIPSLVLSHGVSEHARAHEAAGTIPASGTLVSDVSGFSILEESGGNAFYKATWNAPLTGTLAGSCSATETGVIYASGNWNAIGVATCTGAVNGKPGTFNLSFHNELAPDLTLQGRFVLQGTGELEGVSGHGTLAGHPVTGPDGHPGQNIIYTGQLNLDS